VFQQAAAQLAAASREQPIVIVLDDLHVSDFLSLLLLQFVARTLRQMRVLVIGARRDVEAHFTPEVGRLLARIAREGTSLPLRRLARDEVAAIVSSRRGDVSPELGCAIWQSTQGNPYFLDEILRLVAAQGDRIDGGELPIPFGVREAVRQRLALCDETTRALLEVAAVAGMEPDATAVALAAGLDPETAAIRIAAAVRDGTLVELGGGALRFGHALVREVLYRDLPASRCAELHLAIADALERARPDAPPVAEIAHHALAAAPRQPEALIARVERACDHLLAMHAAEDALLLAERARLALEPAVRDRRLLASLLLAIGAIRGRGGDPAGAREAYARAADHACGAGDAVALARAAIGHGGEAMVGQPDPALLGLLRAALEALPADEAAWRARVQARLAAALQPGGGDVDAPIQMVRDAIAAVRAGGDERALLDVLHLGMPALMTYADAEERRPLDEVAVGLAGAMGDRGRLLHAHLRLTFDHLVLGDVVAADARIDAYERLARTFRQPRHEWPVPLLRSMRALQEGRWADSDALIDEARELAARASDRAADTAIALHQFGRLRAQARHREALAMEAELGERHGAIPGWSTIMAAERAHVGDRAGARARVDTGPLVRRDPVLVAALAEVAVALDDAALAGVAHEALAAWRERWSCWELRGMLVGGTFERHRGETATVLGWYDDAEAFLAVAQRQACAAGARPEQARVRVAQARLAERRGDAGAGEVAARARALVEELGMAAGLPVPVSVSVSVSVPAREARSVVAVVRDGDVWAVTGGERTFRLKDSLGLQYLARLVAEPGRELHALDLCGAADEADLGDAGEVLDPEARRAYKQRLEELDEELEDAERFADALRASRARAEREFLADELARAVGLGGRERRCGSAAERARVAVTRRIRDAVKRIATETPALGRHLDRAIKTGRFCCYQPE
jgi:hypothetical protein